VGPRSNVGGPDPVGGVYVSTTGVDAPGNGSISAPYRTINYALDPNRATPGSTIILRGGTYQEGMNVRIRTPNITIKSAHNEWAVIDFSNKAPGDESSAVRFDVDDAGSSGGRLQSVEVIGGYYAVCLETKWDWGMSDISGVSNIIIEDCVIHDSTDDAVKLKPLCSDVTIRYNRIYNSGRGHLSNPLFVTGQCNAEGIDNVNSDRMHVHNNHIHDICSTGVYAKGGAVDALIESNLIERCYASGIMIGFDTSPQFFSTNTNPRYYENIRGVARNNLIIDTGWEGIGFYAAQDAQAYNNTLVNATCYGTGNFHTPIYFGCANQDWANTNGCPPNINPSVHHNIVHQPSSFTSRMIDIRYITGFYNPNYTNEHGVYIFQGLPSYDLSGLDGMPVAHNNCYFVAGGTARFSDNRPTSPLSNAGFAAWKTHISGDIGSIEANPGLDAQYLPTNPQCAGMGYSSAPATAGPTLGTITFTRCYNAADLASAPNTFTIAPGHIATLSNCYYDATRNGTPTFPPSGCTGLAKEEMTDLNTLATFMSGLGTTMWEKRPNASPDIFYPELKIFKNSANAAIAADSKLSVTTAKPPLANAWLLDSGANGDTRMKHYGATSAWDGWDLAVTVANGTVSLRAATGSVSLSSLANTSPSSSCTLWLNHPVYAPGDDPALPLVNIQGNAPGESGNPIFDSTLRAVITALQLPNTLTNIGNRAFSDCAYISGSLTLPANVKSIGIEAFLNCERISSATTPAGLATIPNGLFRGCTGLKSVTLQAGPTSIGNDAFRGCAQLLSVDIPAGVTAIGNAAFQSCRDMESVTLPHGVVTIGDNAFYSCATLTEITLPASVTTLGSGVFAYSAHITAVYMLGNAPSTGASIYDGTTLTTYVLSGSTGWGVPIPGTWKGRPIAYFTPAPTETLNGISHAWLAEHFPGDPRDYETLSLLPTANGKGMVYCYTADIPPGSPEDFRITAFWLENGTPRLLYAPISSRRTYDVLGAVTLGNTWAPTNTVPNARFFKVEVSVP